MRGLAFPTAAVYEREDSCDHGTPFSSSGDLPQLDPAHSTPFDPAPAEDGANIGVLQPHLHPIIPQHSPVRHPRQYSQGPQGDPFAPQPQSAFFPMDPSPVPPPAKPPKKKRKFTREMECGFCQGADDRNKSGVPEKLLTCSECGRSGHPSCLDLGQLGDVIRSYPWKCVECKNCEVCQEKGGDTRMLFCDACDRGWHMECLQPPLTEEPPGQWNCPRCPILQPEQVIEQEQHRQPAEPLVEPTPPPPSPEIPIDPALREASVASSSRSIPRASNPKKNRKGKAKATTPVDSEPENAEPRALRSPSTPRRSSKSRARWKGKTPMKELPEVIEEVDEGEEDAEGEVEVEEPEPMRPTKRMRLRLGSPVPPPSSPPKSAPIIRLRLPARGKGKEREDEPEDVKKGMFDDFLSLEDRDISQTTIKESDKQRYDRSRISGELRLFPPPVSAATPDIPETPIASSSSRPLRSSVQHAPPPLDPIPGPGPSTSPTPSSSTPDPKTSTTGLRIRTIRFGEYDILTWYDAPFPEEYANIPDGRLWLCEFCLKYMKSQFVARRHQTKCKMRHPPGDEIYRDNHISIFEVDGRKNKIYCQNLCLLSKMFLDHKSLFYDVEPFLFYVMTQVDDGGARFVGYFSKEKRSPKDYNVSCIMTLPVRQRQGWGNLLIDFSYLLSKKEQRPGSPEKPLSALGALGYRNYWTLALMRYLQTAPDNPKLEDIGTVTSMTIEDIYTTLQWQGMISVRDAPSQGRPLPGQSIKFPKGRKNGIARKHLQRTTTQDEEKFKGPFVPPRNYTIRWNPETVEHYLSKWEAKGYLKLKPENLKWSPFLIARALKSDTLQTEVDLLGTPTGDEEAETPRSRSRTENSSVTDEHGANPPKSGSSSSRSQRAHHHIRATDSPAAALFDDDVEVINSFTPQSSSSRNELPAIPVVSSPEAASRFGSPEDVRRSLRRNTQVQVTSLRRSSRQLTTTTTLTMSQVSPPQTPVNQYQRRPVGGMRRNRSSGIRGVGGGGGPPPTPSPIATPNGQSNSNTNVPETPLDSLMADDAALAARLAMEEGSLPRRQLRSRSNTEQDGKLFTMPLPPLRRLSSSYSTTKKRKRVESPSPMDVGCSEGKRGRDTVPPTPTPAPRNTQGPRRSSFRVDKSARMDFAVLPSVTSSVDEKEKLDMVNGTGRPKTKSKARAKGKSGGNRKANGRGRGMTPTTPIIDFQTTPLDGIEEEEQQERGKTIQANTEGLVVCVVPEQRKESNAPQPNVKCEDAGTPVMGVTPGRQSAPSDATVCVVEDLARGGLKGSPEEVGLHDDVEMRGPTVVNGAEEQEEDERVVRAEEEEEEGDDEGALQCGAPAITKPMFICEEGDADAEGEIDEGIEVDAEGEIVDIDADGEIDDDVDAEGELDVEGEGYDVDVDAEGEIDLEETI